MKIKFKHSKSRMNGHIRCDADRIADSPSEVKFYVYI
jgi:hypothetical protein